MDIRRWLEETKTPGSPASLGLPAGQHARETGPRDAAKRSSHHERKRKRPQKHSSSDSSLLQVDRTNDYHHAVTQSTGNGDRARQHTASDKTASRCSSELSGSADRSESRLYIRRPRRRTRPEIYEPKGDKKQSRPDRGRRKDRHAPAKHEDRRRTRRNQPDPGNAFHAKNVASDRLTLKPKEGLGLFKKGRASSPVKGRGLPDLVFSEMRFLQKWSNPKDSQSAEETSRIRKKSGNAAAQEDEISAYFAKRPILAEKDAILPTTKRPNQLSKSNVRKAHRTSVSSKNRTPVKPPVDLPDRPYLGFGTHGVHPSSHSNATYHIPWSESGRYTDEAASQRSLGRSLPLRMEARKQQDDCDDISSDSTGTLLQRTRPGTPDEVPFGSENRHRRKPDNELAGYDSAAFSQLKAPDDPHVGLDVPQTKSSVPPSSHKHWTDRKRQELTYTATRLPSRKGEDNAPRRDVDEQQEKRTNLVGKGNQIQRASAGRPGLRVVQNGNVKMAQDAIDGTTDATKMRAPPGSSSPLGRLLRQCDNACHDVLPARNAPLEQQSRHTDMRYFEKSVEIDYAASQAEVHPSSVLPRWAGGIVPKRPGLYQMQVPDEAGFDNHDAQYATAGKICVPDMTGDAIDDEGTFEDDLAGLYLPRDRSEGYADMTFECAEDRHSIGRRDGQKSGQKSSLAESEGALAGFWRPHKLY